ncbi:hypothetical protein [Ancylobacter pratisalsi]|uniref:Uncharacterized protein n=1 Tax=Ancylobacter pratisalsi TaxID=1745854 RepID=A0A6P1YLT3_9HYPH|nr:hypothetical protein [Ancylobacter pratisalsi]QIB34095.1 hypothetical protein G3A50_10500 [Ancylobacter pratisalsi]
MISPVDMPAPAPTSPHEITAPSRASHDTGSPLDRDADRDGDLSKAAVGIFGMAGLAIVAVGLVWIMARPGAVETVSLERLFKHDSAPVSADAAMLRSGFDPDADADAVPGGFTFLDGATGQREVVGVAPRPETTGPDEARTVTR